MHEGHIKLYRRFRKSAFYNDSQYVHLWIHLLMSVNWTEKRLKLHNSDRFVDLHPGQILTSRDVLSRETGINTSKVERILKALENEQQIEQQTFSKYRVISISNWSEYQSSEQQNEQQMNSKRTADEQQMNTKKKVKKEKKEPIGEKVRFEICTSWNAFIEMRKLIKKPMTDYAMKLCVNELVKLQNDGHDPVAVLNQSIGKNWAGVFPLKSKQEVTVSQQAVAASVTNEELERIKRARKEMYAA